MSARKPTQVQNLLHAHQHCLQPQQLTSPVPAAQSGYVRSLHPSLLPPVLAHETKKPSMMSTTEDIMATMVTPDDMSDTGIEDMTVCYCQPPASSWPSPSWPPSATKWTGPALHSISTLSHQQHNVPHRQANAITHPVTTSQSTTNRGFVSYYEGFHFKNESLTDR